MGELVEHDFRTWLLRELEQGDYQAQRWVLHQVIARVTVGSELVIEYRTPE